MNRATNVFGTSYNSARDFARIAIPRRDATTTGERLALSITGGALTIAWGGVAWSVPVSAK